MKIIITIKAVATAAAAVVMVVVVVNCNGLIYINNLHLLISYYKSKSEKSEKQPAYSELL